MIINLRTLDCLTNSPCQIHWKYIENSMEEMHINFMIFTKYGNVKIEIIKQTQMNKMQNETVHMKRTKEPRLIINDP